MLKIKKINKSHLKWKKGGSMVDVNIVKVGLEANISPLLKGGWVRLESDKNISIWLEPTLLNSNIMHCESH